MAGALDFGDDGEAAGEGDAVGAGFVGVAPPLAEPLDFGGDDAVGAGFVGVAPLLAEPLDFGGCVAGGAAGFVAGAAGDFAALWPFEVCTGGFAAAAGDVDVGGGLPLSAGGADAALAVTIIEPPKSTIAATMRHNASHQPV